jgi:hypothetical protein
MNITMVVETDHDSDIPRVNVIVICPLCDTPARVNGVSAEGFAAWQAGQCIQFALPELSAGDRESLMSGCHEACFDAEFPDDDPPDDYG